ncbi:hypothetical protein [Botrimarina mediterranea]|uniref:hypothetical protein n=1 Tax=Botrimarina mediterranea TaxID=2528022 RepID=UPI0011885C58|nr:hypothetical protein K2D_16380 [Planctomycetes bacterium K2D]
MLTARQELVDFFEQKTREEIASASYQEGYADGRQLERDLLQSKHENWFIAGWIGGFALAGTLAFVLSLIL